MSRCPECSQIIKFSKICHVCKQGIGRGHKYRQIINEQELSYKLEHWDCNNPDTYGKKYEKGKKK